MRKQIARRTFLQHGARTLAALAITPPFAAISPLPAEPRRRAPPQKIVVIGAGMAGLGAALALVADGHDVTVLEARQRPGGRVLTLRDGFPDGLYADAGAMQVYDSHERVLRYASELGLELDPIRFPAAVTVFHVLGRRVEARAGEPVEWGLSLHEDERNLDSRGLWQKYVEPHLRAIYEADTSGALLSRYGTYDRLTFSDFLRTQGASPAAVAILNVGLPFGLGDGGDHHSALNLLREAAYRQLRRQAFTIRGGTDRLPKSLAARLGERIHYGAAVTRIEQDHAGVRVYTKRGNATLAFEADRAVIAIPFAVLRRIEIHPPFSAPKRAVIDRLENTSVVKIFLQTRTRFWLEDGYSGLASTDLPVMGVSERSINQPGGRGLLEAYVAGATARNLCRLDETERLARVVAELSKVFPRLVEQYEGGTSRCWDADEWARGAYAWFRPNQMHEFLLYLAASEGRVHFAGDHTSPTPGWMEGALHSAERVAAEIAAVPA